MSGPRNTPPLSMTESARLVDVSSSGVRDSPGRREFCAGRMSVDVADSTAASSYDEDRCSTVENDDAGSHERSGAEQPAGDEQTLESGATNQRPREGRDGRGRCKANDADERNTARATDPIGIDRKRDRVRPSTRNGGEPRELDEPQLAVGSCNAERLQGTSDAVA